VRAHVLREGARLTADGRVVYDVCVQLEFTL